MAHANLSSNTCFSRIEVPHAIYAAIAGIQGDSYESNPGVLDDDVVKELQTARQIPCRGVRAFEVECLDCTLFYDPSSPSLVGSMPLCPSDGESQRDLYLYRHRESDALPYEYAAIVKSHPEYNDENHDGSIRALHFIGSDVTVLTNYLDSYRDETARELSARLERLNESHAALIGLL